MLEGWYAFFSPDGRLMHSFPNDVKEYDETPSAYVHDVASGTSFEYPDDGDDIGWTPDGHLLMLVGDTVRVCEAMSGACTVRAFDGSGSVKLGGAPYES